MIFFHKLKINYWKCHYIGNANVEKDMKDILINVFINAYVGKQLVKTMERVQNVLYYIRVKNDLN